MKNILRISGLTCVLLCSVSLNASSAFAFETLTNNNLAIATHPAPLMTGQDVGSETHIPLEEGSTFLIERYEFDGVRIWKFSVNDAFWWMTPKGIIWGTNEVGNFPQASTEEEVYSIYQSL